MAIRTEGQDIVISGWENGISNNPYEGINDMRGVNIVSVPGEVSVSFAQNNVAFSPLVLTITSANAGTDIITCTVQTGTLDLINNGQVITFTGASLPAGISASTNYWLLALSQTTFQLYSDFNMNNLVDIGGTGTGTGSSIDISEVTYFEKNNPYCIDKNGRVWSTNTGASGSKWIYLGNSITTGDNSSPTNGNGLCMYNCSNYDSLNPHQYLFVFRNGSIDYLNIYTSTWVYGWLPTTGGTSVTTNTLNTAFTINNPHEALVGINDNVMYITDANYIASLFEKPGQIFDPTSTATFTWAKQALTLNSGDIAQCLAELGTNLLIGGLTNMILPWNRSDTNRDNAILIGENNVHKMITINASTYIFAGRRGRIYITNGYQAELYLKMPDHLSGIEPIFTWNGVAYNKNQLYFGVSATDNAGSAITSYNGLWAVDISNAQSQLGFSGAVAGSLRVPALQSTTPATVTAIYAYTGGVSGYGLAIGWKTTSAYGIDTSSASPMATYGAYVITEIIPIGQFLTKRTLTNMEIKLSAPLVANEAFKLSQRASLTDTWHLIGEISQTGLVSGIFLPNFDLSQWLQFKIEMKSTATNPSYVRVRELRLR